MVGSSPLTRGKPRLRRQGISQRGLIPAHAGKTPRTRRACSATWAHPRSRGENEAARQPHGWETGSSPLTRGKRLRGRPRHRYRRLIPAHAGKTASTSTSTTSTRAHPRSRGENQRIKSVAASVTGSSPLTRGKRILTRVRSYADGLIPAHAGKTGGPERAVRAFPAHPRSRGENPTGGTATCCSRGSSPLTRGKHGGELGVGRGGGLIPAHAGKTW